MSATLVEPHILLTSSAANPLGSRSGGDGLTLGQVLDSVWEGLHADGAAECPVCHGRVARTPTGGACGECGSAIA